MIKVLAGHAAGPITLRQFLNQHGLHLVVNPCIRNGEPEYTAHIVGCGTDCVHSGKNVRYESGSTPTIAVHSLVAHYLYYGEHQIIDMRVKPSLLQSLWGKHKYPTIRVPHGFATENGHIIDFSVSD